MKIKRKWLRDLLGIIFTGYYLIAAEQADEKVRKVRGALTVEHLRISWNKGRESPYLAFVQKLLRPKFMKYPPRAIRIPRPSNSDYKEPVSGWLFFDGPLSALKEHKKLVLDIPGGGFVAMDPRTNDDKLFAWAGKTGLPVLSLDYKKAPEYPYPYALNECYDVYRTIIASRGRCIGFSGEVVPQIVMTGDSAGGNLATATVLMIIESGSSLTRERQGQVKLPVPDGLILIYPGLDLNISNWISDDEMSLIQDRRMRKTNAPVIRRKSRQYDELTNTPHHSEDEASPAAAQDKTKTQPSAPPSKPDDALEFSIGTPPELTASPEQERTDPVQERTSPAPERASEIEKQGPRKSPSHHPRQLTTRLTMSSMMSYFHDRVLAPEMMRSMIILYIGPHNRPDFSKDYLLSPILAPDSLLCQFPKTYFITGERDPLIDDTVIFAGKLKRAKAEAHEARRKNDKSIGPEFDDRDAVESYLIPGISHGFLQFAGCFPEGWNYIFKCGKWIQEIFEESDSRERESHRRVKTNGIVRSETPAAGFRRHSRQATESSGEEDRPLEMMSMSKIREKEHSSGSSNADDTKRRRKELLRQEFRQRANTDFTRPNVKERKNAKLGKRQKSMVSLASNDDLLGRRMLGLTGSLMGEPEEGPNGAS